MSHKPTYSERIEDPMISIDRTLKEIRDAVCKDEPIDEHTSKTIQSLKDSRVFKDIDMPERTHRYPGWWVMQMQERDTRRSKQ